MDGSVAAADAAAGRDQRVADALMRPLLVVERLVGREGAIERARSEEDHLVDDLSAGAANPAFRDGVAVRGRRRAVDDFDAGLGEDGLEGVAELRVTVGDQESLALEDAVGRARRGALHELDVRLGGRREDLDGAGRVVDREENVVRDQATGGPDLGREEVGRDDRSSRGPSGTASRSPALAALGRGLDPVALQDGLDRVRSDVVAEVHERALDLVVAPVRVLGREPDDERLDLLPGVGLPSGLAVL